MIQFFGIRHHGPGTAKRLQKALKQMQPDCLLLELPADAQKAVPYLKNEALKPPVSLLIYPPKDLSTVSYFPLAEFSPEWQALKYALKQEIPVVAMDLPLGIDIKDRTVVSSDPQKRDPIGHIARLAGYDDSERWWDVTFEQEEDDMQVFESIAEMMRALREGQLFEEPPYNIAREAHMRKMLRKAVKDKYEKIAVVCGAWHVPALEIWDKIKVGTDNARLKGLKKTKLESTWIPWNYELLAFSSGYGAGVISPAWYEMLFRYRSTLSIRWMSRVGRLLRKEGHDASPAHTLEAVNLAHTLTAMRNKAVTGLAELKDAAITVFCKGEDQLFKLIETRLITGDKVGKVPDEITGIPIQKDFHKVVKTARLSSALKSSETIKKTFDLRVDTQLLASRLLHRLSILDINWGKLKKGSRFKTGSFSENWNLKWSPNFYIKMVSAGVYGSTIEEAALEKLKEKIKKAEDLRELVIYLDLCIKADLMDAVTGLARKIQEVAAKTKDSLSLMEAIPSLVQVFKYGNQRKSEVKFLKQLIEEILIRINIGLPALCVSIEEEQAKEILTAIIQTNNAIQLFNSLEYINRWHYTLEHIKNTEEAHAMLRGLSLRLLFDQDKLDQEAVKYSIVDAIHTATERLQFAYWMEGFLNGSALLLIHNPPFWNVLNDWIESLDKEDFKAILPILRRTFTSFSAAERQKMLHLARFGFTEFEQQQEEETNPERAKEVIAVVKSLLGMTE